MTKKRKRKLKKTGLPPGTLVYTGDKKAESVRITVIDYDENHFEEKEIKDCSECFSYRDKQTVTWINIDSIQEASVIESIGKHFNIHPLVMEDLMSVGQRPKIENYGEYTFIVIRMLKLNGSGEKIENEQLSLILGNNFVLSFQEVEGDVFDPVRTRIRENKGYIRKMKADYLVYALIDVIVDNYFVILEMFEESLEAIEEKLLYSKVTPSNLQEINLLKRDIILMRRAIWPFREFLSFVEKGEIRLFSQNTLLFFRDVHDHTIQLIDTLDSLREMVSDMINLYLSTVSNRLNEIMKVLTIISTIFIPLTFLAGIYGMNFEYMPELKIRIAYPIVWLVMIATGVIMVIHFKRKGWL